jgi:hypothetical protein
MITADLTTGGRTMLLRFLIRASLWTTFTVVIIAVGAVLAIDIGLVDKLFGTNTRTTLYSVIASLQFNKDNFELGLKIIGLAATVVFGALGMLRAYLLGFTNLPGRLAQFADNVRALHLDDRHALLAPSAHLFGDRAPPASAGLWIRMLRLFGLDAHSKAVRRVTGTTQLLEGDLVVLNAALRLRKTERITVHLVEGLKLADEATRLPEGSTAQQDRNRAALVEFERAVALDDGDLDALELAARQARVVNANVVEARLGRMEIAAQDQHRPDRRARALRLHARVIADRSATKAALRDVRTKLETALAALTEHRTVADRPIEPDAELERALVNEELARLHMRRGTFTLVGPYLDDADELYERLPPPEGPAGRQRIEELRRDLARVQLGGDDPDEGNAGS